MSSPAAHEPAADAVTSGAEGLKRLFRRHAAGVAVITTREGERPVGLLATSLVSLSSEPPLVSFNVSRSASSWPALEVASHLGVHILAHGQRDLADRFARSGSDRFAAPTRWHSGREGVPVLDGVAARAVALVEHRLPVADHVIVVARLLESTVPAHPAAPLLHHDGTYHRPQRLDGLSVVR